jgi:transposase
MSLHPEPWPEPSDEVVRAVMAIYAGRRAPMPVAVRDELGELFADAQFAEAFADRGPQGWSPGRLMLVTVLQAAEGLTDRQAAEAVRDKLSWKFALGLGLTDTGFDASILSEFRTRLVGHDLQTRVLDLMVARLVDKGLLKTGGKQRTDSTHMLAAVRLLNQIELVGESVRACLEAIAAADPDWIELVLDTGWQHRYGARVDTWRMPSSKTRRVALGNDFARDGHALLHAVWQPDTPGWLRELPAIDVLRRVLVQNTKVTTDRTGREVVVVTLRDADTDGLPPGRSRIVSPYDTDARWGGKRDLAWCGFKLHVSESCDAEAPAGHLTGGGYPDQAPNLITNVATTDAAVPDTVMTEPIHQALAARAVLPGEHYLDSGYPFGGPVGVQPERLQRPAGHPDARRHLTAGPRRRRLRPRRVHRRLARADGDLPARQNQHLVEHGIPARHRGHRRQIRRPGLPTLPGCCRWPSTAGRSKRSAPPPPAAGGN